ncbi:unnamed protein product [Notodromas monacha]|uniref:Cleavage and polyadenylation specificity factor subunit 3 n=1 Tax=Notodromas monacha TaxID=399045 RepID=A0A7R9BKS6_9CRUS|nr:unnamed protein product [Notodromas monacha]CAG0915986.1 unnamed protein product [Notodromas monacha]
MASVKRKNVVEEEESDELTFLPLGSGQEVGRSCHLLTFKGKKVLLDMGIHPGLSGMDAIPFVDLIEASEVDILLISHFHLDHCGALPWFLLKSNFRGRCFMTHASKAIYRWLLSDYIKVSNIGADQMLYTEADLEASMDRIETINFHEEREVNGIRFWAYTAGHVLGAAMFMIEIAGVKILYTGDFSREEDRHLCAAEIPAVKPDVLITESTYGTHMHEEREVREARFTHLVQDIVSHGGRCLIPVFALGRAQELLLILDEFWHHHPELHEIPIYYASSLAKKCMGVYQTYINAMNDKIKRLITIANPFMFKHISNLKSIDQFDDIGPCVIMASPGMMQSGLSRELFEMWCTDPKNGVIIAGYCVEGTLAKSILAEPEEITTMSGQKLPLKMRVNYISFSAHADYKQISQFVRALKPPEIILVHGEQNEMGRLKAALIREYEDDKEHSINVHNPKNAQTVSLKFKGEKTAKVVGKLAANGAVDGAKLTGVVIKRNFKYHVMDPSDLKRFTDKSISVISQRQMVHFSGSYKLLRYLLTQLCPRSIEMAEATPGYPSNARIMKVFDNITVVHQPNLVTLEWEADPMNDTYVDGIMVAILHVEQLNLSSTKQVPAINKRDMNHFKTCLVEMLVDMFGEESVPKAIDGDSFEVKAGGNVAHVDLKHLMVTCEDEKLKKIVHTAVFRLHQTMGPEPDAEPDLALVAGK